MHADDVIDMLDRNHVGELPRKLRKCAQFGVNSQSVHPCLCQCVHARADTKMYRNKIAIQTCQEQEFKSNSTEELICSQMLS